MASIRERSGPRGTTYAVLYTLDGKQSSRTFTDRKLAEKFRKLVDAIGAEGAIELSKGEKVGARTVDNLAREWLDWKRRDMTTEGHRDYERQYAKWIKPMFGQRVAEKVTERDVQHWVDKTLAPALGGKSVAGKHALLHGFYKWASAKTRGYVTHNPCKETELPKRTKPQLRGLSLVELHALLVAAESLEDHDARDVIALMAGTGWRLGEALAPSVGDVEVTDAGTFITMSQVFRRGEGVVSGGKTSAANRRIRVLGSGATSTPRRTVGKGPSDLLFPNPRTGNAWNPTAFRRTCWEPVVKAAGLADRAPTPYWLRHTHVAICHAAGMTLPEIQRRIGHESIQTTINVYGRMIDGMSNDVADRLEALLTPVSQPQIVSGHSEPHAEHPEDDGDA